MIDAFNFNASSANTSMSATGGKEKGRRIQNIFPLCIRQIKECQHDEFQMFGMKAQIITIVGILVDYSVTATKVTYTVRDHTGSITALMWIDGEQTKNVKLPNVREGRYVRIYGAMRVIDGEKNIMVLRILPVEDPNEIASHLLEVIHVRYAAENYSQDGNEMRTHNNSELGLVNTMQSMYNTTTDGNVFTPIQKKVYDIIKADMSDNGASVDQLLKHFNKGQSGEVRQVLDYLANEGHIFATIDLNHFKTTD